LKHLDLNRILNVDVYDCSVILTEEMIQTAAGEGRTVSMHATDKVPAMWVQINTTTVQDGESLHKNV